MQESTQNQKEKKSTQDSWDLKSGEAPKKQVTPPPQRTRGPHPGTRPGFRKPRTYSGGGYVRVRIPKTNQGELLGIILENYGSKLLVKCLDGHTRTCRIPGKIRYKVRVRIGDVVLVKKWVVQADTKGDYLYRYTRTQVNQLIKRGFLKEEDLE